MPTRRSLHFALLCFAICTLLTLDPALGQNDWSEDWEGNWFETWQIDAGTWDAGIPTSGPAKAYAGAHAAATVLGGNYKEDVDSRLISPPIELPGTDQQSRLRFWHRYHIGARDTARVQIKVDNGEWQDLSLPYTGSSSNPWSRPALDLTPFAGNIAQFALHFSSQQEGNNADVDRGWYVDDLEIVTGTPTFSLPEGWEAGLGDWRVDQGTWEVGGGPGSAHAGESTAATVLNDNYDEGVASRLISPPFRVPDVGPNPYLVFWHRFNFSARDTAWVQIRVDAGA